MSLLALILLAFVMSLDAFAAATVRGAVMPAFRLGEAARVALVLASSKG